jgi:hypothetical protein
MTLAELSARSGKSVQKIVEWAMAGARTSGKGSIFGDGEINGVRRGDSGSSINTRTPEGREAYDEAVYSVVSSVETPVGAAAIREKVGGTSLQVRTALNRLIEAGKIGYEGRARATRYTTT